MQKKCNSSVSAMEWRLFTINHWSIFGYVWQGDTYSDGLVQERGNSSASAMELHLSCTNPSMCVCKLDLHWFRQYLATWARFLSLARSKLRLCSANHRPGYWSNLPCDWTSTAWAYSKQETENRPWSVPGYLLHQYWLVNWIMKKKLL